MPINFADIIEQINRDGNVTGSGYFPLVHSANIDFTVEGIVGADASRYDSNSANFVSTYGTKYIIVDYGDWNFISGTQGIDGGSSSTWAGLRAKSIVQRGSSSWKTFTDVTNTKSNQGIVVFNKYDKKIYVYSGTEWVEIGSGSVTGAAGQEWSVQFRATDGSLSGSSGLLFDNTSKKLVLGSGVVLQFADGSTQGTARNFFSAEAEINYPVGGFSASGFTGDRLLLATGPANDPFRSYIRYENQWFQTGVVGVAPQSITGDTISSGYGIGIVRDGNSVTVNNIGVTGFNGLTGNVSMTGAGALFGYDNNAIGVRNASSSLTGVASFDPRNFIVGTTGHVGLTGVVKTINGNAPDGDGNYSVSVGGTVTGDSGALGGDGVRITARLASSSLTGVASFDPRHFAVGASGHISLTGTYQVTGQTVVSGGGSQLVSSSGNIATIDNRIASSSVTGVAMFTEKHFNVNANGVVSLAGAYDVTGQTVVSGFGINTVVSNNTVTVNNIGVTGFNGLTGNVSMTGAGGALVGRGNNTIDARLATDSLTGVASFDPRHFAVGLSGHISLTGAYQVTGQTVVAGYGINTVVSGNTVTVNNTGVTGFNGLSGNVSMTGAGALFGYDNNAIGVRNASSSLTGVASFDPRHFAVGTSGHISLTGAYQVTGHTVVSGYGINTVVSGNTVTVNNTGVTGFNGLTGNVSMTGAGALFGYDNNAIGVRNASASLTGVASFDPRYFTVATTGHVGLLGAYQVTGHTVVSGGGSQTVTTSGNIATIDNRIASASLTGVASFDPRHFAVGLSGHISLTGAYQVTGQTVVSGYGINTVVSNNTVTVNNIGVTGFNGLSGNVSMTGAGALFGYDNNAIGVRNASASLTGVASFDPRHFAVGLSGHISLTGAYQVTGHTVVSGGGSQTVNTSGNIATIDNRIASSSLTGVASFDPRHFAVGLSGHISLTGAYQDAGQTVVSGYGINTVVSGNTVTVNNIGVTGFNGLTGNVSMTGAGGALVGRGNNTIDARLASSSLTGVASFDPRHFVIGGTGHVTLPGAVANTTKVHRSNNALGTDLGTARKIAMLAADGSLTFDYIRNYDVFKPTDFTFSVGSFSSSISNPILIGNQSYSLNASSFYGSSLVNGPALTAGMYINTANQGSGFPVYANILSDGGLTFAPGAVSITAGVAGSVQINLIATGPDETNAGGTTASTKTITFSFVNSFLHGVSTNESLTAGGFTGWVTRITSNSLDQTFNLTVPNGSYAYYGYPQRLGVSVNQINDLGQGGFDLQGYAGIPGVSANSYGNLNGFVENYLFYRSNNASLGSIKVDTGANANEL